MARQIILATTTSKSVNHAANRAANYYGSAKTARDVMQNTSAFGDLATSDGRGIVLKGGMASSAFFGSRGASGDMNNALAMPVTNKGKYALPCITIADLYDICTAAGSTDPIGKVQQHLASFVKESDPARLAASGIRLALRKAGFTKVPPAVTFNGKEWDGKLFKRTVTPATVVQCPLLAVVRFLLNGEALPACLRPEAFTD